MPPDPKIKSETSEISIWNFKITNRLKPMPLTTSWAIMVTIRLNLPHPSMHRRTEKITKSHQQKEMEMARPRRTQKKLMEKRTVRLMARSMAKNPSMTKMTMMMSSVTLTIRWNKTIVVLSTTTEACLRTTWEIRKVQVKATEATIRHIHKVTRPSNLEQAGQTNKTWATIKTKKIMRCHNIKTLYLATSEVRVKSQ